MPTLQRTASAQPARVVDRPPVIHGNLTPEHVHRVVRQHINEARFCFERELQVNPALAGDVTVRFVVGANGSVQTSSVTNSSVGNATLEQCLVQATRRWTFPQPTGGGIAMVEQRWSFSNGDDD
jgi:TonB family protein